MKMMIPIEPKTSAEVADELDLALLPTLPFRSIP
jgi:hypothetical protein